MKVWPPPAAPPASPKPRDAPPAKKNRPARVTGHRCFCFVFVFFGFCFVFVLFCFCVFCFCFVFVFFLNNAKVVLLVFVVVLKNAKVVLLVFVVVLKNAKAVRCASTVKDPRLPFFQRNGVNGEEQI